MSRPKQQVWISALVVIAAVTAIMIQHRSQLELREQNESLNQQIALLRADNDVLSNRVAQGFQTDSLRSSQLRELLKLRGEVGLLRRHQRELETALASSSGHSSAPASQQDVSVLSQPKPAPFKLQLVLDEPSQDTETVANGSGGETLHVHKTPLLDWTAISLATVATDSADGAPHIDIEFSPEGKELFAQITKENINKRLAIVLDGHLYSAPVIRSEISGGKAQITGKFTEEEARTLAAKINELVYRN